MNEEIITMINDCINRKSKLSEWEQGFIDSIYDQCYQHKDLTSMQIAKLEDIWERVT